MKKFVFVIMSFGFASLSGMDGSVNKELNDLWQRRERDYKEASKACRSLGLQLELFQRSSPEQVRRHKNVFFRSFHKNDPWVRK